jgi:TatD DNase family protein
VTKVIDSHCHLADAKFRDDVEAAIERAYAAGVAQIVSVGAIGSIESDRLTVEIAERYGNVFAAVGVHPHDAKDCTPDRITALRDLASSKKVVAIGESGLDFHYMHSSPEAQASSLREHLELAAELDLPIVIHCRPSAGSDNAWASSICRKNTCCCNSRGE